MRKYDDDQKKSTLFEAEQAERLKTIRISMDQEAESICQELHQAIDTAQQKFNQMGLKYEPQLKKVLDGTDLENVELENIGFDFSYMDEHGFVLGREIQSPIGAFVEMLRKTVERGPVPTEDSIYFERIEPKNVQERWGGKTKKVTEPA